MNAEAEKLHEQVWRRFVRKPYYHVLDCADRDGNTVLPAPEECNNGIPNVMGWGTCTENGAFFTGLYLYGLCVRDERLRAAADRTEEGTAERAEELKKLAGGLFLLADVSGVDGFIARGVATDGRSHYPVSSEDQFGPWILGLWKLYRSAAADDALRSGIRERILRAVSGMKRAGYNIPTELGDATRGSYAHADWRGVSKLLFCLAVEYELTRDPAVLAEYREACAAHPDGALYSRVGIASHGYAHDMVRSPALIQFWIDVCAHLCLRELETLDPENAARFAAGRRANGITAAAFLRDFEKYDNRKTEPYNMDWRMLIPDARPWKTADEAVAEAGRQIGRWNGTLCPAMRAEHGILGNMLFAAWICVTSGEEPVGTYAAECLAEAVSYVDWDTVTRSYAFVAESALAECGKENENK